MFEEYFDTEEANKLYQALGGVQVKTPVARKGKEYDFLVDHLGGDLANKFCDVFKGEQIYIPKNYAKKVEDKHRLIIERFKQLVSEGHSSRFAKQKVALEMRRSSRNIARILKKQVNN